jgi:O-Antigen ligase
MAADLAEQPVSAEPGPSRVARVLSTLMVILLALLAVEVLLEGWVQELLGDRFVRTDDVLRRLGGTVPEWPKTLKNGLLLTLVAVSVLKITVERRWREFTTRADLALVVLGVLMVAAGLFGTSGPVLIGQALFVYFRGAIVFYAVRALRPSWDRFRWVLWAVGAVLVLDVLVALVQMVAGWPAYRGVGWVDPTWADIHRAQGLLDHPNHLGHVLGLALIGMVAWIVGLPRIPWQWWVAFAGAALGLAATQSRESMVAALIGSAVVWFLRRRGGRTVIIASAVVLALFGANLLARPENIQEIKFRLGGVSDAISTPSGTEDCAGYDTIQECTDAGKAPSREIRLLFYQQGAQLLQHRPLLGYGVGQFGGIVAEQADPNWESDPRFGPEGFNLYDFDGTTVDSFWLHLAVEVGLLGLLAYLAWLVLLALPLIRSSRRYRRDDGDDAAETEATGAWAVGALVFAVIVAALSPALEDPLFPPLLFGVVGIAWVLNARRRVRPAEPTGQPAQGATGRLASSPDVS